MTPMAISFVTPLLLLGALAAAIPFALHLLSSVRAQDMMFPTLRFLRMSMEKTARRRRLQHWLLLVLRALLFALLALAVAEPLSEATGGWLAGQRYSAAVVLDNGYSMAVNDSEGNRFERAKADAVALLSGDDRPTVAALLTTNGGFVSRGLTGGLDTLRNEVSRARIGYGPVPLAQRVQAAIDLLDDDSNPRKAVYLLSDLQRASFEKIAELSDLARASDVHLLVVDTARGELSNVGISDLTITGQRVVDKALTFVATVINSSPRDKTVDVALQVDGAGPARRVRKLLRAAGQKGSTTTAVFQHRFRRAGPVTGKVFLDAADGLALDNVRRFSMTIGGRVRALVVRGPVEGAGTFEPSAILRLALQAYEDEAAPWPIRARTVEGAELSTADLAGADIAFFSDVARFTDEQARAVADFVANGATAVFFLGPNVDAAAYNEQFVQKITTEGGLLPGRIERAVGQIGPEAESIKISEVAYDHPYFAGLFKEHGDYLTVLVQRYYTLAAGARPGQTLVGMANGAPLIQLKRFGGGRVVLCTTSAGAKWSNLPITPLFLSMVARMSLLARHQLWQDATYLADAQVTIRPSLTGPDAPGADEKLFLNVTPPGGGAGEFAALPVTNTDEGLQAVYKDTTEIGLYKWKLTRAGAGAAPTGAFVVNPFGPECRLEPIGAEAFRRAMGARGLQRVYVAPTLAAVHAAAAGESEGTNWWDLVLAVVIIVLVLEAVVANRRSREQAVPDHLVPGTSAT
jgi:hypothetical protein